MIKTLFWLIAFLLSGLKERREPALENLALRQQLAILKRSNRRPQPRRKDRLFWVGLSMTWKPWPESLVIVRPDAVVRWHRQSFRLFWAWISHSKPSGRPAVTSKIGPLIRKMAGANPLWGAPRIHGELMKLVLDI
jgi:putative transposase